MLFSSLVTDMGEVLTIVGAILLTAVGITLLGAGVLWVCVKRELCCYQNPEPHVDDHDNGSLVDKLQ